MKDLQDPTRETAIDSELLAAFDRQVWQNIPHEDGGRIVGGTPLVDLTEILRKSAAEVYGLDLSESRFAVFGKLEARILAGSVKTRPAAQIIRDAITSGRLRRGQVVFEATSGNFGIALGQLAKLGVRVIVLVSRKLQAGVLEDLERSGVSTVNLDVDICPAPGVQMDPNMLVARIVATSMRERLQELGLPLEPFDSSRQRIEELLARQDVINLAKLLAEAYGGFCPAQYENELNPASHERVTGPEIDEQLKSLGLSLGDSTIICTFGTGGTSKGLTRFVDATYGKKTVHVIFPREGQDVAGIRTRSKATGLAFYRPETLAGQHDVDFVQAKKLLLHLAKRESLDLGESSALALYAVLQMVNFGTRGNFVVILADGVEKYRKSLEAGREDLEGRLEVSAEQAREHMEEYGAVVWTHPGYSPNEEGVKLMNEALGGKDGPTLVLAPAMDVARAVATRQISPGLAQTVANKRGRVLLVCMSGNTSLKVAQLLSANGIKSQSLVGGITGLSRESGRSVLALVKPAT